MHKSRTLRFERSYTSVDATQMQHWLISTFPKNKKIPAAPGRSYRIFCGLSHFSRGQSRRSDLTPHSLPILSYTDQILIPYLPEQRLISQISPGFGICLRRIHIFPILCPYLPHIRFPPNLSDSIQTYPTLSEHIRHYPAMPPITSRSYPQPVPSHTHS